MIIQSLLKLYGSVIIIISFNIFHLRFVLGKIAERKLMLSVYARNITQGFLERDRVGDRSTNCPVPNLKGEEKVQERMIELVDTLLKRMRERV